MNEEEEKEALKKLIAELWSRARINAFAHRMATNENSWWDFGLFFATVLFSLIGIFSIIISYITRNDLIMFKFLDSYSALDYAFISIAATFFSLMATIFSNHKRYGAIAEQHRFIQNSYIHIAQRTRPAKNPTISKEELTELHNDLERDFAMTKARGIEPQDKHFKKAEKIEKNRRKNRAPLSFIEENDEPETEINRSLWQRISSFFRKEDGHAS